MHYERERIDATGSVIALIPALAFRIATVSLRILNTILQTVRAQRNPKALFIR